MNEQVVQIAKRIKELREVLEMSLEDVAMQLGVCIEDYQRYEEGKDDIPVGVRYGAAALFSLGVTVLLLSGAVSVGAWTAAV